MEPEKRGRRGERVAAGRERGERDMTERERKRERRRRRRRRNDRGIGRRSYN